MKSHIDIDLRIYILAKTIYCLKLVQRAVSIQYQGYFELPSDSQLAIYLHPCNRCTYCIFLLEGAKINSDSLATSQ